MGERSCGRRLGHCIWDDDPALTPCRCMRYPTANPAAADLASTFALVCPYNGIPGAGLAFQVSQHSLPSADSQRVPRLRMQCVQLQDDGGVAPATPSNGNAVVTVPAPADADPDTVSKAVLAVEHGGANGTTPGRPPALPAPEHTAKANGRPGDAAMSPASPATVPGRFDGGTSTSPGAETAQTAAALVKAAVNAGACSRSLAVCAEA